jgi:hypothetical protein
MSPIVVMLIFWLAAGTLSVFDCGHDGKHSHKVPEEFQQEDKPDE